MQQFFSTKQHPAVVSVPGMPRKENEKLPAGRAKTLSDILIDAPFEPGKPLLDLDHQQAMFTECVDHDQG